MIQKPDLFLAFQGLFVARLFEYSTFKNHDGSRNWWIMFARAGGESHQHCPKVSALPLHCSLKLKCTLVLSKLIMYVLRVES